MLHADNLRSWHLLLVSNRILLIDCEVFETDNFIPIIDQEIAVVIALWSMFGSIGAAVGFAIAGGLWTNILPEQLYSHLPEESKNLTATIYSSLAIQQEYPLGDPIRNATIAAYADVQRKMVIAGSAFIPILLLSVWMWKNINVKKLEKESGTQTKGTIF